MKKIIEFILRRKIFLLFMVALLTVGFSLKLAKVEMKEDEETFISPSDPIMKEYREFQKTFEADEGVIVAYESSNIFSGEELEYLKQLHGRLETISGVQKVTSLINADDIKGIEGGIAISPVIESTIKDQTDYLKASESIEGNPLIEGVFLSEDQKVVSLIIDLPGMFNGGSDSLHKQFFKELSSLVENERNMNNRILHIGGDIVTDASIEQLMDKDLSLLFPLTLLFSALILFFFYRKLITTFVPLIPVLITIVWVLGLKGWTGVPMTPISITLFPLIMVIGLANSVHIISHYQKIRPTFNNNSLAIKETLNAVIKPCFSAAFTTAAGFGSLAVSNVTGIQQMGIFAAFGVMVAFALSIIIIPAALIKSKAFSRNQMIIKRGGFLYPVLIKLDKLNQNHPWKILATFIGIILFMEFLFPK